MKLLEKALVVFFLPLSILLAISISPTLESSSTFPISFKYILTGSSVLPVSSSFSTTTWLLSESSSSEDSDDLYNEAVSFVLESRRASISAVQRKLRIGYNRAARLIESMEEAGLVSEMSSNGSREVLVPKRD